MEAESWVREQILSHLERHRIMPIEDIVESIVDAAAQGCYAFNIRYLNIGATLTLDPTFESVLNGFEKLDHRLIFYRPATETTSAAFSYDGGRRFQWFEPETIFLDPAKVREIKIDQIIRRTNE